MIMTMSHDNVNERSIYLTQVNSYVCTCKCNATL